MIKFKIIGITLLCFLVVAVNAQASNLIISETTAQLKKAYKGWTDSFNTGFND